MSRFADARSIVVTAPSALGGLLSAPVGIALWFVAIFVGAPRLGMGAATIAGIAAFVLTMMILPPLIHARQLRVNGETRTVVLANRWLGVPVRRRVYGFGSVGKVSLARDGGDGGLMLEVWIDARPVRFSRGGRFRSLRETAEKLAEILGKKAQTWGRSGNWT